MKLKHQQSFGSLACITFTSDKKTTCLHVGKIVSRRYIDPFLKRSWNRTVALLQSIFMDAHLLQFCSNLLNETEDCYVLFFRHSLNICMAFKYTAAVADQQTAGKVILTLVDMW